MKKYKIPVDNSMIKLCDTRERAISITPDILESADCPDGFFAINDETASGILYACKLVGKRVPNRFPIEVGKNVFGILIDKLEGNDGKSGNRIVKTNLVVRGTTK